MKARRVDPERSRRGGRWFLRRADLAVGAGRLLSLFHPLLPDFASALPAEDGLLLRPEPPAPAGTARLSDQRLLAGFLARLAALAAFLKFHGLGVAFEDLPRIGSSPASPACPALGAAPVPEWRAVPPALLVSAVAVRLGGTAATGRDAESLRRAVEDALASRQTAPLAVSLGAEALQLHVTGGAAESLLPPLARRAGEAAPGGAELLGLASPSVFDGSPDAAASDVRTAEGDAALFVVRGASRRSSAGFVEIPPGDLLEDGGALRRLARALSRDPRADALAALASGAEPGEWPDGPRIGVVALSGDSWDARSKRALDAHLGLAGFSVFETRNRGTRPWERRVSLMARLSRGDVAALLWLPFRCWSEASAAWDSVAEQSGEDAALFLRAARETAGRFDPSGGLSARTARAMRRRPAGEPLLAAAALLASGFTSGELAAAGGVSPDEAARAIDSGRRNALLVPARDGGWRFTSEEARRPWAARLSSAARRSVVARLVGAGLPADRVTVAALGRGETGDLRAGEELFARAMEGRELDLAVDLLHRAPGSDPDLGRPDLAVAILAERGLLREARAAARRLVPERLAGEPSERRRLLARHLARLGEGRAALALVPGDAREDVLSRVQVLLDLKRTDEAARTLDLAAGTSPGAASSLRLRQARLAAEIASRRGDLASARRFLDEAAAAKEPEDDPAEAREILMTAGFVALDDGRFPEARALFRRARDLSADARGRADALLDAATAAFHAGLFPEAEEDLASALALYAEDGDDERYLSALGNRIDLAFRSGRFDVARETLPVVLRHESRPGREHQFLFAVPSRQRLARLDGDPEAAASVFREAEACGAHRAGHPAWRAILILEGARLLSERRPKEALDRLEAAGALPDNREQTESLRIRLIASASGDLGRDPGGAASGLEPRERLLLSAEGDLRCGKAPRREAVRELESRLRDALGAAEVVERLLEWQARFPAALARHEAASLLDLGRRAAARAGLSAAAARFVAPAEAEEVRPPSGETALAWPAFVAEDSGTRKAVEEVQKVAPTRLPVLILGETGTGKELLARELHRQSGRRGRFVAVNVAALPGSLMESELFGHSRGAFTGADRDHAGLVEQSSGGTLFLDEIGDLPLPLQAKLLRVLQEKELRRVGEVKTRTVDLRVVSATHRDLAAMVDEGSFRRDLLYRLAGLETTLPPLRRRPLDLSRLVAGALGGCALTSEARTAILGHPWPGNVRELLSALEAARALAAPSRLIGLEHLPAAVRRVAAAPDASAPRGSYRQEVADAKRRALGAALEASGGNRTRAAKMLGLSRQSLLYEMKVLRLASPVDSGAWRSSGGSRRSRSSSGARRPSSSS